MEGFRCGAMPHRKGLFAPWVPRGDSMGGVWQLWDHVFGTVLPVDAPYATAGRRVKAKAG